MNLLKTVIEPNGKNGQYWKDIWRYRELAINLAKRDITVRYKQTVIGLGWTVISPVLNMLIMTFIFGNLAGMQSDPGVPYPIMVYAGLIPWTLLSKCLQNGSNTFITHSALLKKVYFPRILAPIGTSLALMIDTLLSFLVMIILMIGYRYLPPFRIILFPVFLFIAMILGIAAGLAVCAYNVKWRDLAQMIPFLVQIGQYLSPVAYTFNTVPAKWQLLYSMNPAAGIINAFKWCLIRSVDFHWTSFIICLCWIAFLVPFGIYKFRKAERNFVDLV